jgi:hypothetical protein
VCSPGNDGARRIAQEPRDQRSVVVAVDQIRIKYWTLPFGLTLLRLRRLIRSMQLFSWGVSGSPDGRPAVMLRGGPGQGCAPNMRGAFDPRRYRIILFDQRGRRRSTPHASAPATEMRFNTTQPIRRPPRRHRNAENLFARDVCAVFPVGTFFVSSAESFAFDDRELRLTARSWASGWRGTELRVDFREAVRVMWPGQVSGVVARAVNLSRAGPRRRVDTDALPRRHRRAVRRLAAARAATPARARRAQALAAAGEGPHGDRVRRSVAARGRRATRRRRGE